MALLSSYVTRYQLPLNGIHTGISAPPTTSPLVPILGKSPLTGVTLGSVTGAAPTEPFGYNPLNPVLPVTLPTGGDVPTGNSPQTPTQTGLIEMIKSNLVWIIAGVALYFLIAE